MSTWLYQLNAKEWTPKTFRYEIWEGKPWHWGYGKKQERRVVKTRPQTGDTLVFFYAPTGCPEIDRGFYGWAVLERLHSDNETLYFLPAAPTNHLKMDPWWDDDARQLVDQIRGGMPRATLFRIEDEHVKTLRAAIRRHLGGNS